MNRHDFQAEEHIDEGDLVRYLDGEMSIADRSSVAAHLLACRTCAESLENVRSNRQHFADLIATIEVPAIASERRAASLAAIEGAAKRRAAVSRRSRRFPILRAAAVGGLVFAASLSTTPVRALIADFWNAVSLRVERLAGTATEVTPSERVRLSNATIGFVLSGDVFTLEVSTRQAEGRLILGVGLGGSVTASTLDSADSVDLVILPTGMRIENRPDATSDYGVNVPSHVREFRVRVGDAPELVYHADDLAASWISVIRLGDDDSGSSDRPASR